MNEQEKQTTMTRMGTVSALNCKPLGPKDIVATILVFLSFVLAPNMFRGL